jgi:TonB family protein
MTILRSFSTIIATVILATIIGNAQSGSGAIKHFEKYNVSFDYPADWKLTDSSTDEVQNFILATAGSAAQIAVIVQPDPGISCASEARSRSATSGLVDWVAVQIHAAVPVQSSLVPTSIGPRKVAAVELHGIRNNKPVTAYIGSLTLHNYFINVLYLKIDNDESGTAAWETVRTSLRITDPLPGQKGSKPPKSEGILNGKAISLFSPEYPMDARRQRASGTVVVEVEIDESGTVTLACAISGDPLLRAASVAAAKRSRFTPTKLSGKPVRIIGVIQYRFVAQ